MLCKQLTRDNKVCNRSAIFYEKRCYIHIRKWLKLKLNLHKCPKTAKEISDIIKNIRNTDPNYQDAYGHNIIHIGVLENNIDLVRKGINLGIDVNARSDERYSPLHFINNKQILLELLKAGASINKNDNTLSRTPLLKHCLLPFPKKEIIRCFFEWGANLTVGDDYTEMTYEILPYIKFTIPNFWNNVDCIKWRQSILLRFLKRLPNITNRGSLFDVFFNYFQLSHILCIQNV